MTNTMHDTDRAPSDAPGRGKRNRADTYHPAMRGFAGRRMPAGHVWLVVVIALFVALLFNSAGFLRDAHGMQPGPVRTVMVAIGTPVDAVAGWLRLDRPQQALATALGQADDREGAALLDDAPEPAPVATAPSVTRPTAADPLDVLVLGDSLSTFVGQQMSAQLADSDRVKVKTIWRNGTGLTNPAFFNWQSGARSIVRSEQPDAVVVLIGGNERNDMTVRGKTLSPGSAEWETEYERRARVVMRAIMAEGVERVFWSGPPTARDPEWNSAYADVNDALRRAAAAVPGVQYVDLYDEAKPFAMEETIDGERVVARQRDGIHWTYPGALVPARAEVAALETVYGVLNPGSTSTEVPSDTQPPTGSESSGP
jgi:hypothetical protein